MTPALQLDENARGEIRDSLDTSLIVEAAAGTGKTTELINRIVSVIARGGQQDTIDRIVAVTFTRKAAGELKLRLRQELDRARAAAGSAIAPRIEHAIAHLEEARIGTIHSFCAEILRERPVEALVDPAFQELDETQAPRLFKRVFRRWMEGKLNDDSPGLRRALCRIASRERDDRTPMEQLEDAGWKLIEWRDFDGSWVREPFDIHREIDGLIGQVTGLDAMAARSTRRYDNLLRALDPVRDLATWVRRAEEVRARDYETLEGSLVRLLGVIKKDSRKGSGAFADGITREEVVAARDAVIQSLEQFRTRADADLASLLHVELSELIPCYEEAKRRAGKLDFVDLLVKVRDLVRDRLDVRLFLQQRFSRIFVDEFQDTDPLQAEILILLSADDPAQSDWLQVRPAPGKLFLVGDPKQSIYRFRRADVILYQSVSQALQQRGVKLARLSKSFRSSRPIQQAINAAFEPEMTANLDTGQPDYVALEHHAGTSLDQPPIVVLPVPRPYGKQRIARYKIEESLPDAIGAYVEWLIAESGWKARSAGGEPEPISSRHICLLFRRFMSWGSDMTRPYVRNLEARNIPHLLVGARSYHQREEVETLRAALTAVEWPDDELSVFATLRGSLFSISDAMLLRFRHRVGSLHPFRPMPEDLDPDLMPVVEVLGLLAALHRRRNQQAIAATVNALLRAARAHAGFALRPGGHQVLANVNRVVDLARAFELGGGISFRGFVDELTAQAERADSAEAPVLEEGAEGVRLMTVHTAKGLEFPVVILADITANLTAAQADRYVDPVRNVYATRLLGCTPRDLLDHQPEEERRDRAEGVRIAYVAATRARDLLVVPAVGDGPLEGWLSPLHKAIYPATPDARRSVPAPSCPAFANDSVLERPPDFTSVPEDSVKPGLHTINGYSVVWWDPRQLNLGVQDRFGIRQQEILEEDGAGAAMESIRRYDEWKARTARVSNDASQPQFTPFTATQAVESPPGKSLRTEMIVVPRDSTRPSGRRFGTLVHTLIAQPQQSATLARVLGATAEEATAAGDAARAALAHPLLERASHAKQVHREWPVILKLKGGKLFEGVIDLAFFDEDAWTIVDFKTDAHLTPERYQVQLAWYVYAVQQITRQQARGVLLSV